MSCATTILDDVYTFYLNAKSSSICYRGSITATTANISATTVMFAESLRIKEGIIDADKIFIQDDATTYTGKVKFKGDVYLVQKQDFDSIRATWTNSAMNKYLEEHSLKPIHYENETYDTHFKELVAVHDEHLSLILSS